MITAVYKENRDTHATGEVSYDLLMVVTRTFLSLEGRELWLIELAEELADGDLWAVRLVEFAELSEVPDTLGE